MQEITARARFKRTPHWVDRIGAREHFGILPTKLCYFSAGHNLIRRKKGMYKSNDIATIIEAHGYGLIGELKNNWTWQSMNDVLFYLTRNNINVNKDLDITINKLPQSILEGRKTKEL